MWIQKAHEFRKLRGDILAASFEIENTVDEIVAEVFFPGLQAAPERSVGGAKLAVYVNSSVLKSVFGRLFLKASATTLGRKVGLLKEIFE